MLCVLFVYAPFVPSAMGQVVTPKNITRRAGQAESDHVKLKLLRRIALTEQSRISQEEDNRLRIISQIVDTVPNEKRFERVVEMAQNLAQSRIQVEMCRRDDSYEPSEHFLEQLCMEKQQKTEMAQRIENQEKAHDVLLYASLLTCLGPDETDYIFEALEAFLAVPKDYPVPTYRASTAASNEKASRATLILAAVLEEQTRENWEFWDENRSVLVRFLLEQGADPFAQRTDINVNLTEAAIIKYGRNSLTVKALLSK